MLSVVIPVHNEEKNIIQLYKELKSVLGNSEIIFVDDGSTDNSLSLLLGLSKADKNVKVVKLKSNYGQSSAIAAGIECSKGDHILTMDSDLQHDPKDIPKFLHKLSQGYDIVCGWRKNRASEPLSKTLPSILSNMIIRIVTGVKLRDSTGGMRAFKREVIENIKIYGEMHRYLPILAKWKGFKVSSVPINIRKRKHGKTKYNATRIFRGFLDLITIKYFISYSTRPIHIFGTFGFILFFLGFLIDLFILYRKIFLGISIIANHQALLILSVLLIILGINSLFFGFIADMISFDAITSQRRKTYIIDKIY